MESFDGIGPLAAFAGEQTGFVALRPLLRVS